MWYHISPHKHMYMSMCDEFTQAEFIWLWRKAPRGLWGCTFYPILLHGCRCTALNLSVPVPCLFCTLQSRGGTQEWVSDGRRAMGSILSWWPWSWLLAFTALLRALFLCTGKSSGGLHASSRPPGMAWLQTVPSKEQLETGTANCLNCNLLTQWWVKLLCILYSCSF